MFFHTLRDAWTFFTSKYSTFLQQKATTLLQRAFTNIANQQGIPMLLAIGTFALVFYITEFFYITGIMIGRNISNHSLKKKKEPFFNLFGSKTTFFPMFLV